MARTETTEQPAQSEDYLKSNTFLKFLDSLLPYLRLDLNLVKDALETFDLKVNSRNKYGDTLHLAAGSIDEILTYFPGKEDVLQPLVLKLSTHPFGAQRRSVQFLDVLIILTLLTKGALKQKAQLLYSFFALAEPEGLLEYEHAGLIQKVGSCLKKIEAIRPLDLTADDSRYLADIARRNEEEGGYYKSLNFTRFFHWITHSKETTPAFHFIRLVNRMLHVVRTLDAKTNAIASMLEDITSSPDTSIGIPKYNRNNLILQQNIPQIVFCSSKSISLLLSSLKASNSEIYALIDMVRVAPNPLFEFTSKDLAKRSAVENSDQCCTKTYHITTRQCVRSPPTPHNNIYRLSNPVDIDSFQVTVFNLEAATDYILTLYTSELRFPPVKVRTPDVVPLLPCCDDENRGDETAHDEVKLVIFPASMSVENTVEMVKTTSTNSLLSPHSLQMIFTGPICPINEAAAQMISSARCFFSFQENNTNMSRENLGEKFSTVATSVVETYYSSNWHDKTIKLFSLTNSTVAVEGLTNEASCSRCMMIYPSSPWDSSILETKVRAIMPDACFSIVNESISRQYMSRAGALSPPTYSWQMGFTRVLFLQPSCVTVPPTIQPGGQIHASFLPGIVDGYTANNLSNTCNHLVLLMRTPEDLMKHVSLWGIDDVPPSPAVQNSNEVDVNPVPQSAVRRGKHEILYGAHSATPDKTAQNLFPSTLHHSTTTSELEVRSGGDLLFNKVIRSLHRWLSTASVGTRRVTLVSCRWSAGIDFSLCLDGDTSNFISHVSLEPTGLNTQCTTMLTRVKQSFNDSVSVETGPLLNSSRVIVFDVVGADGFPSAFKFQTVPQRFAKDPITAAVPPLMRQKIELNGGPKISYLSDNEVCVELITTGCGYICCSLYEVPCMVGFADVQRIVETELSSLHLLKKLSNRFIGNHVDSKFIFRNLASFCAYCVVITTSADDPSSRPDIPEAAFQSSAVLSAPPFVHFRTFNKPGNSVSSCLLAGVLGGDLKCSSAATLRIKEQLDGNGRPLAAPVYLFHHRLDRIPSAVDSDDFHLLSQVNNYSDEVLDLFRMGLTVHIGEQEMVFSNGSINFDARASYEQQNGSIHLSSNGRFARIALSMDTAKAFQDLANCVTSLSRLSALSNISVFVSKPLIHHMENKIVGSSAWEKSKHYDKKHYFPALMKALTALQKWKKQVQGRDVQVMSIANVSCTLVTYFHSLGKRGGPPESGFRHFTLPLYIHQKEDAETCSIPCGTFKLDSNLCYTTFTYNKGVRKSDLRNGTPFQMLQPHFHLHGYTSPEFAKQVQNVLYKVSVFTGDEMDLEHLTPEEKKHRVTHNHITVKSLLDDIDNMELLLGPVIGQVTTTSVNIIFEVNRQADNLMCVLRPVGKTTQLKKISHRAMAFQPVVYKFEDLQTDQVYEILMPELHGETVIGKFRSLSSKAYFSEIMFIGDEHLENFPIAAKLIDEMVSQQVINFEQLRAISYVRKYEKDSREAAGVDATLDKDDPAYRRPWISLSQRMKSLACTTSTVFHLGSHALLSRLLKYIIPPLVDTVKKYNIDMETYEKTSAVSKFYQMQLDQVIEDSLRLVWIVEPVLKDVFCNSSNIPLYNSEYWLSESSMRDSELGRDFDDRDIIALEKIRKLFTKNLENFIYPLKSWTKRARNHFHVWKEGTVTVITLDQTSEQLKMTNKKLVGAANSALGRAEEKVEDEEDNNISKVKAVDSKTTKKKKKGGGSVEDEEDDLKAKTYDASFMSEHQWKQIRAILMEKDTKQLVICMQFPMIPMDLADVDGDEVADVSENDYQGSTQSNAKLLWTPKEEDVAKFFGQLLKWLMPKKGKRSGKTISFVCVSNKSYLTNIQDMKSGIKIQQLCLGKFSCVKESFSKAEASPEPLAKYKMKGKVGTWKFQHRVVGLDEVTVNSDYCGTGGVFTGRAELGHEPYSAVYGIMKFWFDSWKPIGVWNFNKIRAIGPPDAKSGDAIMLVGPIIGAPQTFYVDGNRAATTMMVPFLFELDRKVTVTCVATDLFNGTQFVITQEILKHRPTVFRLTNLNIDSRYTIDFVEGVQNAFSSRFVIQTHCNWDDSNIMIFNMEQRGAQNPTTNDSSYIKEMSDRLRVPFHGINCAVHVNCFVDVKDIFDEVEFMPELKELLVTVKVPTLDEITRTEVINKLRKLVMKIMDRVRLEYRLYFSRPSYRELLLRGFHLFMGREVYKEVESTETDPAGSLIALLRLISSRVNQEYFDQLVAAEDETYSAWPRIEYTEEMKKRRREKEEEELRKQQQINEGEAPLIDESNPDGIRLLTLNDYKDKHILNVPLLRRPFRTFFDNAQNPVDCVLFQWLQNFVPPPVLWKPYVLPNQKVTIESFCTCDDRHIRDIHHRIVNSEIHRGARLIIMPNVGPLMNPQSLLGYKMSQWTRRWIKEGVDRTITLVCPSKEREGSYNYTMTYGAWPDPVQYARSKPSDIPPPLQNSMNIQTLHSIYMSNEKEITRIKKEKVEEIKEKTKTTAKSRGALAKKKKDEDELKEKLKIELQEIFNALTPDGFVLFENRTTVTKAPFSAGGEDMTIGYTELKTVGTKLDKSESANVASPKPYDYLHLPQWVLKFVPASTGVFVQDEVSVVIRQEPHSRKALDSIESDENIVKNCKKIYLSSRLSELSRPEDMREYDMEVEGIKEMFLEEVVARIWREALPDELKSRMFTLTDEFVRTMCLRKAFNDIEKDLSSPLNFCKAIRRLLLASAQMFLAFKMSKMERWKYIMETPEFPEDFDKPYASDDDNSDIEDKDDDRTELTTKEEDAETETKMSESVADFPSILSSGDQKSMVDGSLELLSQDGGGGDKKAGGDASTVEGLFDRNMDNASVVPKNDSEGEGGGGTGSKDAKKTDGENDDIVDQQAQAQGNDEGGVEKEEGNDTVNVQEEGVEEQQQEQEEELVVVAEGTPPEDCPPSDSEKVALKQVDTLFNLNWRRLERNRVVGERLTFMTTNHLS